ncbi:hypothetical protein [Flammeovirga aprica]|uniref:Uncharacterized protein n=1 Tax=Flammeovirga aprica JL-4 TaxID=694437 RepID=A0A7X9S238_9BACT|nr:hypothetical protein [Flammeovirga aprica]NME72978.1 hypothetical protein [Flammeovirga aprica JL-4]
MKNKYLKFYELAVEFLNKTDCITEEIAKSGSDEKINLLEKRLGFKLPERVYHALKIWGGNGLRYYKNGSFYQFFLIEEAIEVLENIPEIRSKYILSNLPEIKCILPLKWYSPYDEGEFIFMNCDNNEADIYKIKGLFVDEDDYGNPISLDEEEEPGVDPSEYEVQFSGPENHHEMHMRRGIKEGFINGIKFKGKEEYNYINFESFEEITWAKFYQFYIDQNKYNLDKEWDDNFVQKMYEIEQQTGEILGIEAYEIAYIKYLIEEKGVPPIPHIYDPYSDPKAVI